MSLTTLVVLRPLEGTVCPLARFTDHHNVKKTVTEVRVGRLF